MQGPVKRRSAQLNRIAFEHERRVETYRRFLDWYAERYDKVSIVEIETVRTEKGWVIYLLYRNKSKK